MEQTLAAICERLHGELIGDGTIVIRGVNALEWAKKDDLVFAENPARLAEALATEAAAIIVPMEINDLQGRPGIRVQNPKLAFAILLGIFHPEVLTAAGTHPSAVLGTRLHLGRDVSIGAHAVIGDDVSLGEGTVVAPNVYIGDGVRIGKRCRLDPCVVVYRRTEMGDRVWIHAGSVIGGDGFGYVFHHGAHVKIPQVGNVVIEDDVEIGCNCCIDRAMIGSTLIRQGTKMDNLVQVAHNDRIGKHVILAGQTGLSGSVTIGDYSVLGGRVGTVDHITIGERVTIGVASIVTKSVPDGRMMWGYPAREMGAAKRQAGLINRLPLLAKSLAKLVADIKQLKGRLARLEEKSS